MARRTASRPVTRGVTANAAPVQAVADAAPVPPPEVDPMKSLLLRLKLSDEASDSIMKQGYDSLEVLADLTDDQVSQLCKIVRFPGGSVTTGQGETPSKDLGCSIMHLAEVNLQLPTKLPKETREAVSAAVNAMPSQESREQAKHLLEKMAGGGRLNNEQLLAAAEDIKETVGSVEVEGDAAITAVAGALQSAASMNEEVCAAVADVLVNTLELAENLPLIGAAAGALGVLIRTFRQTQKADKNIKTVLLWCVYIIYSRYKPPASRQSSVPWTASNKLMQPLRRHNGSLV